MKKSRLKKIVAAPDETPESLRKSIPVDLVNAFLAVSRSNWKDEKLYSTYVEQAELFLGKAKHKDPIACGALVVKLTIATLDLVEKKQAVPLVCATHPNYKGKRIPKNNCKDCMVLYEKQKTQKVKAKKVKGLVGGVGVLSSCGRAQGQKERVVQKEVSQKG